MTSLISMAIRPLPLSSVSSWDVAQVRSALDEHETGRFADSAMLLDAFGRDDRISACFEKRCMALASKRGLPFEVEPSTVDGRRGKAVAAAMNGIWWDAHGESVLRRVLRDAIGLGVAVGHIEWNTKARPWVPELVPLHASNLYWDEYDCVWKYRTLDGDLVVTPGDGKWFLYTPGGDLDPWLDSAVRALGMPFVLRSFTMRDWARWSELHGLPTLLAKVPSNKEDVQQFLTSLRARGREGVIFLPQGDTEQGSYGVDMLEAKDGSWSGFLALLERIDICTAVYLLGQNLTTEVQGGSYAAAQTHGEGELRKSSSDAEGLATALREQIWKPWAGYVYGNPDLAGWGKWDTSPPEDRKASADTMNVFADGLGKLIVAQVPVDIEAMAEQYGVPLRAGARVPEPEAPDPDADPETPPPAPTGAEEPEEVAPVLQSSPDDADAWVSGLLAEPYLTGGPFRKLSTASSRQGMVDGQMAADRIAAKGATKAQRILAPDVAAVLAAIEGATTYDEIKARLVTAYEGMSPEKLSKLVEKGIVLSKLAGKLAILTDL